ncbi:MAG TPA: MmcQ/YjbR family DNA-binding protein [Pseudonocardia sp.]|nr:MmcQ/YjbR family DNA-binding protein [Pseudonocardia sp.]
MREVADVPVEVVTRLRAICLNLPESYEEVAWTGIRWLVRGRTYAHVLAVCNSWPPAYARAVGAGGPATVLTFRSSGPELSALGHTGPPFFPTPWRSDEVGLLLGDDPDWIEITELLHESYRARAPRNLVALLDRGDR